jgi:hypothetical protein
MGSSFWQLALLVCASGVGGEPRKLPIHARQIPFSIRGVLGFDNETKRRSRVDLSETADDERPGLVIAGWCSWALAPTRFLLVHFREQEKACEAFC